MGDESKKMTFAFPRAEKKLMDVVQSEDIGQLAALFEQYKQDLIKEFFLEEGFAILKWTVVYISNPKVFSFLVDKLPRSILKDLLETNDFEILKGFLRTEAGEEKFGQKEQQQFRIDKFKLLLKIDAEWVKKFMDTHRDAKYFTKKIAEDFEIAQKETLAKKYTI